MTDSIGSRGEAAMGPVGKGMSGPAGVRGEVVGDCVC